MLKYDIFWKVKTAAAVMRDKDKLVIQEWLELFERNFVGKCMTPLFGR